VGGEHVNEPCAGPGAHTPHLPTGKRIKEKSPALRRAFCYGTVMALEGARRTMMTLKHIYVDPISAANGERVLEIDEANLSDGIVHAIDSKGGHWEFTVGRVYVMNAEGATVTSWNLDDPKTRA
jgi:hypothetical protein